MQRAVEGVHLELVIGSVEARGEGDELTVFHLVEGTLGPPAGSS